MTPSTRSLTRRLTAFALLALLAPPRVANARPADDPAELDRVVRAAHAALKAGRHAEARRQYLDAAPGMPEIGNWLVLRAALLTPDSAGRAMLYARLTLPVVRARITATEALARERVGDLKGAALRYDTLGRAVDAFRVRLAAAPGGDARRQLRDGLANLILIRRGTAEAKDAIELLFTAKLELSTPQALIIARAAAQSRLAARAVTLFPRCITAGIATPEDRLAYGLALAQLGRHREAAATLARVPVGSEVSSEASYQRAISLSRLGLGDSAAAILARLTTGSATSATVTSKAIFLAGELRWRAGDTAGARSRWLEVVRIAPREPLAARAGFLAAMTLWESGRAGEAGAEWERVHLLDGGADGQAAGYWAGRAFEQTGALPRARGLWQSVMARDSLSYYAVASARRLGVNPWRPTGASDHFVLFPDLDSTATRLTLLRALDLTEELGWERDRLLADSTTSAERLLASANLLRGDGQAAAAVTLGRRALQNGAAPDARSYRLIFPILHESDVRKQAAVNRLDPIVVAALIRQESMWEAKAKSRAGALGLMQVMPATGRQIARALGIRGWKTDLLLEPATNIRFGTQYLAGALRRFDGDLGRALAAYNAGPGRVATWANGVASTDPEWFVERISITETRDYVRIIQRNLAVYRALYGG